MTWIKICGITNLKDAQTAVAAGADALGFVFYDKSPRKIDPEMARQIVTKIPESIEKVGVFVEGRDFGPIDTVHMVGLTAIQNTVRGNSASPAASMMIAVGGFPRPPKIFLAVPADWFFDHPDNISEISLRFSHLRKDGRPAMSEGFFDTVVLDSRTPDALGGTGKTFDWHKSVPIADGIRQAGLKLVVAGGLTPANVSEAIDVLKPWGVDVSSGVEARPGRKDPEKIRAFVNAVRTAEKTS